MVAVRQGWVQVSGQEDEEEDLAEEPETLPLPAPRRTRWPRVSLAKRVALAVAILAALLVLFLPQVLQGGGNGQGPDPIGGVFPTAAIGASTTRWHTRAQMPTPRTDLGVVEHEGLIYAIGGVSDDGVTAKVEVYDPKVDAWTSRRSKPTPVGFISAVVLETKIYVPGGVDAAQQPRNVLEVYDPALDAWEIRAPLPRSLGAYGLAALDGRLYLFGGRDGGGYVATAYRYDPQADAWEELDPMDQARGFLGAAALRDRIYVVGGYDAETEFNTCQVYDPQTGTWASCAPMSMGRGGLAVVTVRENLYAVGGGMSDGAYLAFNERYDPRIDTWDRIETPVTGQWRGLGGAFIYPSLHAIGGWKDEPLSVNEAYQALYQIVLP